MRLSDGEQQRMEQRLAFRFAAIGDGAQSWLERQLSALSPECALADQMVLFRKSRQRLGQL